MEQSGENNKQLNVGRAEGDVAGGDISKTYYNYYPDVPKNETTGVELDQLVDRLAAEVNECTRNACDQTVPLVQLDQPIQPTSLQMISEPQRVTEDMDEEGHYHCREDFMKVYAQREADISEDEMFIRSREFAAEDSNRACRTNEAREDHIQKHGNVIGVVGQPGIGKTTSIKKWSRQMLSGQIVESASIVFLILVRFIEFSKPMNLLQFLLSTILPHWKHTPETDKALLERLSKLPNLVLAFDGLDEANVQDLSMEVRRINLYEEADPLTLLFNLMNSHLLPNARKIFTSRPAQLYNLHQSHRPIFMMQILGLDQRGQDDIGWQICADKYEEIKDILMKNPDAYAYCYVPVNFILTLSFLMRSTDQLDFVCLTRILASACEKYSVSPHLKGKECELDKLCHLAWTGFLIKKIIFETDDLTEAGLGENTIVSFLNTSVIESANIRMRLMDGHKRHYFSHLIWQEFFAAVHLVLKMPLEHFVKNIPNLSDPRWEVVTKCAFGLLDPTVFRLLRCIIPACSKTTWQEKKKLLEKFAVNLMTSDSDPSNVFRLCSWVHEANDEDLTRAVACHCAEYIEISGTVLPSDISNLFFVLRAAPQLPTVGVERCGFTGDSLERFSEEVASMDFKIRVLNLSNNVRIADSVAASIGQCIGRIGRLNLDRCGISIANIVSIMDKLEQIPHKLKLLDLTDNKVGDDGAAIISRCVGRIESLILHGCGITGEGAQLIAEKVEQVSERIKELDLSHNKIGDSGAIAISNCLANIERLDLSGCRIRSKGATAIAEKLSQIPEQMEYLGLSQNMIGKLSVFASCLGQVKQLSLRGSPASSSDRDELRSVLLRLNLPLSTIDSDVF